MTKPVTGVALMTLWEQGRFGLDEPLAKYLPEYADVKVFAGLDSAGKPVLKTPARPIVIRDIMRHTAGFVTDAGTRGPRKDLRAGGPAQPWQHAGPIQPEAGDRPARLRPGNTMALQPCGRRPGAACREAQRDAIRRVTCALTSSNRSACAIVPGRSRKSVIPVSPRPTPPDATASSGARARPISAVSISAIAS